MLAARGVSLGLGKIKLNELNQLGTHKQRQAQAARRPPPASKTPPRPRYRIKKKADEKVVYAACRAVFFGILLFAVGLSMAVLGYFDKQFSLKETVVNGTMTVANNKLVQYHLKTMQYLGPIIMGIGAVILIVACVVTLESRDKHAQVVLIEAKKRRATIDEPRLVEEQLEQQGIKKKTPRNDSARSKTSNNVTRRTSQEVVIEKEKLFLAPLALADSMQDLDTSIEDSNKIE